MPTTTGTQSQAAPGEAAPRGTKQVDFRIDEDTFVANVSHELRIPLTNLKMRLYLARMQPEKIDEHLRIMETVTDRMRTLVEDLLDATRLELGVVSLDRQRIAFQDLIASVIELQRPEAERKSITLTADMPSYPVPGHVDPNRIIQVLTNLIANALNYTPEGGEVWVQLSNQGENVIIRIYDNGIGIPAHLLAKIFEPFFRVGEKPVKGSGLGLAITKAIVEAHGGTIEAKSKPGQGSVFSVKFRPN